VQDIASAARFTRTRHGVHNRPALAKARETG